MFDKDYILNELRNGRDYEEIMDEISNVLNEAAKEFDAEKKERNERQDKIEDMQEILDLVHDYCINHYGKSNKNIDEIDKAFESETAEKYVDLIDSGLELVDSLAELDKMFNFGKKTKLKKADPKGEIEVNIDLDADKILSDFLKLLK